MKWSNLSIGLCPNELCEEIMIQKDDKVFCGDCGFRVQMKKYLDIIKGKESDAYKKKVRQYKNTNSKKAKDKRRALEIEEIYKKERESNLRRMNN